MKILFVYPNIVESPKDISTGIGMLSALVKQKGHKTKLLDSSFGIKDSTMLQRAKAFGPDLIAFSTATNDFTYACHIANVFKKHFNVPIIAGGFHPTIAPEETISQKCFDMICVGEGDEAFVELVEKLEKGQPTDKVKNIWSKKNGEVIKNPIRNLVEDLDALPFPDRDIFDYEKYLQWNHGTATFISTRGCPFQCTYCINHFLMKKYKGKGRYVRFRSVNNLFEEIKQVLKKHGEHVKNIEFYDDTFSLDKERVKEFCERYPKEIGIPFNLNVRVNAVDMEVFKHLKEAGCARVSIGIEAGDEKIRNSVLKRNMTDKQIVDTFLAAKKVGLKTYSFNMVGIPYETKESIKKTIELNKKCKPDYVGVSIFNVFKGTEVYDLCEKKGWIRKSYSSSYFRDSNVKHPNFSVSELRKIRNSFGFKVFLSYKPLRAIMDLIDRNFAQIDFYILIRSKILDKLRMLR